MEETEKHACGTLARNVSVHNTVKRCCIMGKIRIVHMSTVQETKFLRSQVCFVRSCSKQNANYAISCSGCCSSQIITHMMIGNAEMLLILVVLVCRFGMCSGETIYLLCFLLQVSSCLIAEKLKSENELSSGFGVHYVRVKQAGE